MNVYFGPGPVLNSQDNTLEKDTLSPLMGHHVTKEVNWHKQRIGTLGCRRAETGKQIEISRMLIHQGVLAQSLTWNQGTGVLDIVAIIPSTVKGTRAFSITGITHGLHPGRD